MHCDGCVRRVKTLLGKVDGIGSIDVRIGGATIEVPDDASAAAAVATLEKAGYKVAPTP
jgi:copper chaperone CopZ